MLQFFERDHGNCGSRFLLSREVGNAVGKNFYTPGRLEPQYYSVPVRATKSPSSPHHKFSSLTIFVGVAQPFGSSRESLNVIDLCIFLKLFGNANYLQLPALFQKDHSPNLFLSEFRGFFSLSQQNRYNRQK